MPISASDPVNILRTSASVCLVAIVISGLKFKRKGTQTGIFTAVDRRPRGLNCVAKVLGRRTGCEGDCWGVRGWK